MTAGCTKALAGFLEGARLQEHNDEDELRQQCGSVLLRMGGLLRGTERRRASMNSALLLADTDVGGVCLQTSLPRSSSTVGAGVGMCTILRDPLDQRTDTRRGS